MRPSAYAGLLTATTLLLAAVPPGAEAWDRGRAQTFATLPEGAGNPEGITVDGHGNFYVSTFAPLGTASGTGEVFVLRNNGKLLRKLELSTAADPQPSTLLLELAFHPTTGALLVIDFGNQRVLSVDPVSGDAEVFTTIPGGPGAGPNVLTFDDVGNVYISDSFQGVIWVTGALGGAAAEWISDPLLTTGGVPPFGANGIAFSNDGATLYVANTGNDTVLAVPVGIDGLPAGPAEVFVNSVNGADGLIVDEDDNLWIAANQADEIVVVDPTGRAIARLGDFEGLSNEGAAVGLLFPASLVRSGGFIYVTNLALDLRLFGLAPSPDSQWAAEATRATVARIRARIPPIKGLP
jgi:sugar lactone lactonase YvrE